MRSTTHPGPIVHNYNGSKYSKDIRPVVSVPDAKSLVPRLVALKKEAVNRSDEAVMRYRDGHIISTCFVKPLIPILSPICCQNTSTDPE